MVMLLLLLMMMMMMMMLTTFVGPILQLPPDTLDVIHNTIDWILTLRLPSGNLPMTAGDHADDLVQVRWSFI